MSQEKLSKQLFLHKEENKNSSNPEIELKEYKINKIKF